ncbi:ATP-dependent DNA helicase RecQ [Leptolyngbya sp. FACHB-321]|uniref:RecQ family ATP-dependent DNA helicase n=1 Tax=Leptolyngbya sp. FACHB-321 TaxID=2692807 RepID=UPI001683E9D5|nr:ATP-dependent DNA helicase RecQ [Leptolyngbya sp. FACHB-321]MBD2035609.1 ATP-dependent DNA helicase RecQ [Leptolyngbya sp. FACHB-321]
MNHPTVSVRETIRAKLKQIWGYDDFRSPQGEIVQCLLEQRDALIIMPTGGGKSLCFQLPALMQTGLTIVVSPLVALMENQVQELRQRRLPAALLHSEVSKQQRRQTLWALENQSLRLLYLSPETLLSEAVWERLCQPNLKINGLILDEAHCLVQWGDTFRPAYYRLGIVRPALLKCKPEGTKIAIAAFTATANPDAQQTIQRVLQLQQPEVFRLNPYRTNLHLNVQVVWTPRQRRQQMLKFIQAQLGQAGLVYVRTRRDSETLAEWLSQQGFQTAAYHAGLSADERRQLEKAWLGGTIQFVICTCAFGMGIDKPDCRWVVHFHSPLLLSEYVQEVGRAGRDGKPATALTLISETTGWLDPEDKQRRQFFVEQAQKQQRSAQALSHKLPTQGDVASVSRQFKDGAIALSLLNSTGHLEWSDPFHYVMKSGNVDRTGQSNTQAAKQMTEYLKTRDCRWRFLLSAFGFEADALNLRCGHCDNCRH